MGFLYLYTEELMLIYYGEPMQLVVDILGAAVLIFFLSAGITSILEKESRAATISFIFGILLSFPFLLPLLKDVTYPDWLSIGMLSLAGGCLAIILIPFSGRIQYTTSSRGTDR